MPVRQQPARRTRRPCRLNHSPRAIVQGVQRHKPLAGSICSAAFFTYSAQHFLLWSILRWNMRQTLYLRRSQWRGLLGSLANLRDTFRQPFRGRPPTASSLGNFLVLYNLVRRTTHGTVIRTAGALLFCGGLFA